MRTPRAPRRVRRSVALMGGAAWLVFGGVACGSDDDAAPTDSSSDEVSADTAATTAESSLTVPPTSEPTVPSSDDTAPIETSVAPPDDTVATGDGTVDTAVVGGDATEPDPAAAAEAFAVLTAIAERNDNVSGTYDVGTGEGCPLIADFEGMWLAEAGGTLLCGSADNLTSVGVALSGPFAETIVEGGFEEVGSTGAVRRWCVADACLVSWTDGEIDAFTFSMGSDDPSVAERFLLDHLVEVVDGVAAFDVEQIPAA